MTATKQKKEHEACMHACIRTYILSILRMRVCAHAQMINRPACDVTQKHYIK